MLQIGCGSGDTLALASKFGWQVVGVEAKDQDRAAARVAAPSSYVSATVEQIPPHHFDLILLLDVLETQADPFHVFYELAAKGAIAPTTTVIATTRNSQLQASGQDLLSGPEQIPEDMVSFFSAPALVELFRALKFSNIEIGGFGPADHVDQVPFTSSASLWCRASGSDLTQFMQERYVPGTWSELAEYEHIPRYIFARGFAKDRHVLDFGCGSGYGTSSLAGVAKSIVGVDISEDALAYARFKHPHDNISFVHSDTFGAELAEHSFDLIVCFEVIEHVEQSAQGPLIQSFQRLLAPGGVLLISTPNPAVTSLYGDNPYHLHEMSRLEFEDVLRSIFPRVNVFLQTIQTCVVLQEDASQDERLVHERLNEHEDRVVPAAYLAVCSEESNHDLQGKIVFDTTRSYTEMRVEGLRHRNEQLIARFNNVQRRANSERISQELSNTQTSRDVAEAAVRDSWLRNEQLISEMKVTTHRLEAAEAELTQVKEREVATSNHLEALSVEHAHLQNDFAQAVAQIDEQTKQTERLDQIAKQSQLREEEFNAHASRLSHRLVEITDEKGVVTSLLTDATAHIDAARMQTADMRALFEERQAEADRLRGIIETMNHQSSVRDRQLHEIEASTTWRIARRAAPLMQAVRPVLRPVLRKSYRFVRNLRDRRAATRVSMKAALLAENTHIPQVPLRSQRHMSFETRLDPVWNSERGRFDLHYDATQTAGPSSAGTSPYVVQPLALIDPDAHRPKILHVIPNVFVGGSTQLIIDIVQHLSHRFAHEVLTSALWPGGSHVGLTVHHVSETSEAKMAEVIAHVKPDLIHVHFWGLTDTPWYDAAFAAMSQFDLPVVENINTPIAPYIHRQVRSYIFVSHYVREVFGGDLSQSQSAYVIYPGIDLASFGAANPDPDAANAIGMVYRLEDDKLNEDAIELFIEVVRQRPRTKVYIIGGGRFLQPYLERTEACGVRDNFRFTGYVPYKSLPSWYDRFSLFVAPVWKESFGQVAPFAMAKGSAVAGYAIGALPEILDSSATLGTSLGQAASLIVALLNDPDRLREIGRVNRARSHALFGLEAMVASYAARYDELLSGGPPRAAPLHINE